MKSRDEILYEIEKYHNSIHERLIYENEIEQDYRNGLITELDRDSKLNTSKLNIEILEIIIDVLEWVIEEES